MAALAAMIAARPARILVAQLDGGHHVRLRLSNELAEVPLPPGDQSCIVGLRDTTAIGPRMIIPGIAVIVTMRFLQKCPKPPHCIDLKILSEAPAESDANRIVNGEAPGITASITG